MQQTEHAIERCRWYLSGWRKLRGGDGEANFARIDLLDAQLTFAEESRGRDPDGERRGAGLDAWHREGQAAGVDPGGADADTLKLKPPAGLRGDEAPQQPALHRGRQQ